MGRFSNTTFERKCEVCGIFVLALTVLLFLALVTDGYQSGVTRPLDDLGSAPNALGSPGSFVASTLAFLFGSAAHVIYCILAVWSCMLLRHLPLDRLVTRIAGLILLLGSVAMLIHVDVPVLVDDPESPAAGLAGGIVGEFFASFVAPYVGLTGTNVIAVAGTLVGILLSTELLLLQAFLRARLVVAGIFSAFATVGRGAGGGIAGLWGRRSMPRYRRVARGEADIDTADAEEEETDPDDLPMEPSVSWDDILDAAEQAVPTLDRAPSRPRISESRPIVAARPEPPVRSATPRPEPPVREVPPARPPIRVNVAQPVVPASAVPEPPSPLAPPWEEEAVEPEEEYIQPQADAPESDEDLLDLDAALAEIPESLAQATPVDEVDEDEVQEYDDEEAYAAVPEDEAPSDDEEEDLSGGDVEEALLEPVVQRAPAPRRKQPMLRRKGIIDDELPPDYEYPKRYTKPSIDIFAPPPQRKMEDIGQALLRISARLESTLQTFSIEAKVVEITRGPTITRFELEPAPGIKVSRFVALADDLALALKAHRVRVEAPIPGKGRVGIEVPNKEREAVVIRELLESREYVNGKGTLKLALGKDISGHVMVADLATMPHLLVAGATGAGKTVAVKTMIACLLASHTPDELQMMFIDPKMVELSIFNDIPHLITPVVTDPKKAATSLQWLIAEMEERYRLFTHLRVRNIEIYNKSVENGEIEMTHEDGTEADAVDAIRKLPYIVCIIDELADLMIQVRSEVEDAIARLAQLARAVGIHLIIATQRPSVDVLTGVIKANFPARISFQVSSKVDSRCILDQIGAERLIGMGDMLYLAAGQSKPTRIQGAFVSDDEMNRLIAYLKTQAPPQYRAEIERFGKDQDELEALDDEEDELFDDAVRVVLETGQASISMVQRRLRVGYTRAARLIDMMEMRGIVGPHVGSKAREILVQMPPDNEVA